MDKLGKLAILSRSKYIGCLSCDFTYIHNGHFYISLIYFGIRIITYVHQMNKWH